MPCAVLCCGAEELWRHLGQCGVDREDPDAAETFGKHPKKILEIMEHSRSARRDM